MFCSVWFVASWLACLTVTVPPLHHFISTPTFKSCISLSCQLICSRFPMTFTIWIFLCITRRFFFFAVFSFLSVGFDIGRRRLYRHFDLIFTLFLSSFLLLAALSYSISRTSAYTHTHTWMCRCAVLRRALSNVNCVRYVKSVKVHGQEKKKAATTTQWKETKSKKELGTMYDGYKQAYRPFLNWFFLFYWFSVRWTTRNVFVCYAKQHQHQKETWNKRSGSRSFCVTVYIVWPTKKPPVSFACALTHTYSLVRRYSFVGPTWR